MCIFHEYYLSMLSHILHSALRHVASEVAEAVDADSWTVDEAMSANPCFNSPMARSMLLRDIVLNAADIACSRDGVLDFRTVNGQGRELRYYDGDVDCRYRIRSARRVGDEMRIQANSDSVLAQTADPDQLTFGPEEQQWVLGWIRDDDGAVEEVFVARSFGADDAGNWLRLGTVYPLLDRRDGDGGQGGSLNGPATPAPTGGFTPTDESLPGFEDDQGGDEGTNDADYGAGS